MSDPKPASDGSGGGGGGESGNSPDNETSAVQGSTRLKLAVIIVVFLISAVAISAGVFYSAREIFDKSVEEEKIVEELEKIEEDLETPNKNHHHHQWHGMPDGRGQHNPNDVSNQGKPGQCPPSDGFGITVHECSNDHECGGSKKCCAVGGGAGQMCKEPIAVSSAEKPGQCPHSNSFGITIHECNSDFECGGSKKCCPVGGGVGQACQEPASEKPGYCPPSDGFGITVHECSNDFECGGSMKCCAVGGGAGQMCKEPDLSGQVLATPSSGGFGRLTALEPCPDWDKVWVNTSASCKFSLRVAKRYRDGECSSYADFIKCMSFVMRTMNHHCSEDDLRQMAQANHRDLYTRMPGSLASRRNRHRSSLDNFHSSHYDDSWSKRYDSSSKYFGGWSDWYGSGSSSYYSNKWSDWYDSGSSSYYSNKWSDWYDSSSSSYYGNKWSDWYGSGSSSYYSNKWSDWYDSGSSSYYGNKWSDWYDSSSSSYYGNKWSDWYDSGSSSYYGNKWSDWYDSSSSSYYGNKWSDWYDSGSSSYYGNKWSDWYDSSSSSYYGNKWSDWYDSSSSNYYGNKWSDWYDSGSSSYYGNKWSDWYDSSSSNYYGNKWSDWYDSSSSSYYGNKWSDWYDSSSSNYYGNKWSDWYDSGSSSYYGSKWSDWYDSDSSKYYGSGDSSWPYDSSSGWSGWGSSSSSRHYDNGWNDWKNSGSLDDFNDYGNDQWGSGSSSDYSSSIYPSYGNTMYGASKGYHGHSGGHHSGQQFRSLPDSCKNYVAPTLVDMMMTEPCANPDAYEYVLKYHCKDTWSDSDYHHPMILPRRRRQALEPYYATTTSSPIPSSSDSNDACLVLFKEAQCVRHHFKQAGLTCSSSTIFETIENYKHSVLTSEVDQCSDLRKKLNTDSCYQAITSRKATCLHKFHNTESQEKACSMFKAAVKCIKESYPDKCGRKHASQVLRQWLSAAGVKRQLSSSLGIDLNCDSLRLFAQCSSIKVALAPDRAVLMQIQGKWARVCADGWNDTDAQVVCRSLGFNVGYASSAYDGVTYYEKRRTQVEGRILNMKCAGREKSPFDCPYMKGHNCPSNKMGIAICYKSAPVYEIVSDKQGTPYGYVRRTADGRSALVTARWTNDMAADLFCKAAGYPDGGVLLPRNLSNIDTGSFRWNRDSFSCEYTDTTIEACAARAKWKYEDARMVQEHYDGSVSYITSDYYTPVKVFCFAGGVRLHNGFFNSTGIPEVVKTSTKYGSYPEKQYLRICKLGFDNFTASLFCRALGLGFQSGQAVGYQPFAYGSYSTTHVKFSCKGNETKLSECYNRTAGYSIGASGSAVVKCTPPLVSETVPEMTVKLGYDNRTVLVYKNHQWGHIGSVHWTNTEAEQVCKALNFDTGSAEVQYAEKTFYPYLINNVSCQGADSWRECRYQDVVGDVSSDLRSARAFCYNQSNMPVYSLYNGKDAHPHYGWVQVTTEGTRGRLCTYFYNEMYGVLCRQLGFVDGEEYTGELPDKEINSEPMWVTKYSNCMDSPSLEACRSQPWSKGEESPYMYMYKRRKPRPYCSQSPVKVFCYKQARVHSGYFNTSGILEVADQQTYRPVCAKSSTFTQEAADVVCHNLTSSRTSSGIIMGRNVFMFNGNPAMHVNFSCEGTEQDLDKCMTVIGTNNYNYDCYHDEEMVAVVCYEGQQPADGITEWKIGVQDSVLAKRFGLWGHVCAENWTDNEAAAVCRMQGHYSGAAMYDTASATKLAQWVDSMSCPADASGVSQCSITMRNYTDPEGHHTSCSARRVRCFEKWEVPTMFFVDNDTLSSTRPQGRVAVTYNGTTGYFCPTYPRQDTHSTLCRLMGYPRGGEALNPNTTSLAEPYTYPKAWQADLRCDMKTRDAHYVTCMKYWNLQSMRQDQDTWYGGDTSFGSWSSCGQHVPAVSCFDSGDYRLIPSPSNQTRRLLAVWNGGKKMWETVCRDGFSDKEASAACREVGFSQGGQIIAENNWSIDSYSMGQTRFQCSGVAGEKLSSCSSTSESCYHYSAVWVGCNGTS